MFYFDAESHTYTLDGSAIPSVTQMLGQAGYISEAWYTGESAERGRQVHRLCADYDWGVFGDLRQCDSEYKNWLLAYVRFKQREQPVWASIEDAFANTHYRFGGRPDRVGKVYGCEAIVELKSGAMERWHGIQTALHDILIGGLPVRVRMRYGLYLRKNGKFRFVQHDGLEPKCSRGPEDYDLAYEVIQRCTGR